MRKRVTPSTHHLLQILSFVTSDIAYLESYRANNICLASQVEQCDGNNAQPRLDVCSRFSTIHKQKDSGRYQPGPSDIITSMSSCFMVPFVTDWEVFCSSPHTLCTHVLTRSGGHDHIQGVLGTPRRVCILTRPSKPYKFEEIESGANRRWS